MCLNMFSTKRGAQLAANSYQSILHSPNIQEKLTTMHFAECQEKVKGSKLAGSISELRTPI